MKSANDNSQLTRFIETVAPQTHLRVERELGDGFVLLRREEAERRQAAQDVRCTEDVIIELLRNAGDAQATQIFVACTLEAGVRTVVVLDNGCGIPNHLHDLVFHPRVTSKLDTVHLDKWGIHGRGMALYSIRERCEEARVCQSAPRLGTSVITKSRIADLPEKSDQSTFPTFTLEANGTVKISGPKNILRTACEFALEHRGQCAVYVGSPSEIAAALVAGAQEQYSLVELSLKPDCDRVPLIHRPAFAQTPLQLADTLAGLGLSLSTRTARRIQDGEVTPAEPLHERIREALSATLPTTSAPAVRKQRATSSVRIASADLRDFAADVADTFAHLAETYYLDGEVRPQVSVKRGRLTVTIPLTPKEQ